MLVAGVPPVVMEGMLWRNRIASAMLRRLGMHVSKGAPSLLLNICG